MALTVSTQFVISGWQHPQIQAEGSSLTSMSLFHFDPNRTVEMLRLLIMQHMKCDKGYEATQTTIMRKKAFNWVMNTYPHSLLLSVLSSVSQWCWCRLQCRVSDLQLNSRTLTLWRTSPCQVMYVSWGVMFRTSATLNRVCITAMTVH